MKITKKAFSEGLHYSTYGTGRNRFPYIVHDWKSGFGWKYIMVFQKGTTKKQALDTAYEWIGNHNDDIKYWSPVYTWKVADTDDKRFKIPLNLPYFN